MFHDISTFTHVNEQGNGNDNQNEQGKDDVEAPEPGIPVLLKAGFGAFVSGVSNSVSAPQ